MVGFGSSLRIARRPGWEGAYLDYETLKLLLSQIEAVYEEEGHRRRTSVAHVFDPSSGAGGGESGCKSKHDQSRDYRDELFLASDSDEAYMSVEDSNEECMSSNSSIHVEADHKMHSNNSHNNSHHQSNQPFLLSYSKEPSSSDEENASGCGGVSYSFASWGGWEKSSSSLAGAGEHHHLADNPNAKKSKFRKSNMKHLPEEDAFYMDSSGMAGPHAFYMNNFWDEDTSQGGGSASLRQSFLNAPVVVSSRDTSSLLPSATATTTTGTTTAGGAPSNTVASHGPSAAAAGSSLYTFSTESITPPMPMYGGGGAGTHLTRASLDSSAGSILLPGASHLLASTTGEQQPLLQQPQSQHHLMRDPSTAASSLNASPLLSHPLSASGAASTHHHHHASITSSNSQKRRFLEERKRERRQRRSRRKRLRELRKRREKKAPRHLRLAHSKARAITERFLGLLRAETEKVILFAQSRLGELADTAGSLRFSNIDDFDANSMNNSSNHRRQQHHHHHHHHHGGQDHRSADAFDYPLSDAGLHPSASSSEDEGVAAGQGIWSDSSEEDTNGGERIPTVFAAMGGGTGSDQAASSSTRRRKQASQGGGKRSGHSSATQSKSSTSAQKKMSAGSSKSGESSPEHESRAQEYANAAALRQIAHFTELRKRRPIFLRNDQILGEDMLLISAVEEVDGYTAVGVELIHVLRFICVNLIAVRKICGKHDRLLMNRMLGGYYHRTTKGPAAIEDTQTLGGLIARNSGDIYEAQ